MECNHHKESHRRRSPVFRLTLAVFTVMPPLCASVFQYPKAVRTLLRAFESTISLKKSSRRGSMATRRPAVSIDSLADLAIDHTLSFLPWPEAVSSNLELCGRLQGGFPVRTGVSLLL